MDTKLGQKEKPKFAPPSAREKQSQDKETKKLKNEETIKESKVNKEVDDVITVTPTAEEKSLGFIKATHMSDKHRLKGGLSKKGTGEENSELKKKVVAFADGDQAGSMENSTASQSVSDEGPEKEVIKNKVKKEKVKNKQQKLALGGKKDTEEVTNGKKQVHNTGEECSVQTDEEKKKRQKHECTPKIKEKQEHKLKPTVALTDSQYEDLFDSVLGAAQLETCMEDARAMLSEVELLQASIDQEVNKMREEEEEIGDICQDSEENEQEIQEDRRKKEKETHSRHKEKVSKIGKRRRKEEDDDDDSEADEYDSWVQCSRAACKKWRRLQDDTDPSTLPKNWTCGENTDQSRSSCDAPEECWTVSKEEEFYYCSLVPGSLVWAQQTGYPWWPAMIERDPVTNDFLLFKTRRDPFPFKCHVTYFGSPVSRAWVQRCRVRDYNDLSEQAALNVVRQPVYKRRLKDAIKMAGQAQKIPLQKRLNRFGFMTRRAAVDENSEEDSDIEEILALIAESSGKRDEGRKRAKGSGNKGERPPQKQRKHTEGRVEEPNVDVSVVRKAITSGTETTKDAGKTENEENKQKECDIEENSETEKARREEDQYRATESKEKTKVTGKKMMKKPEKERMEKGKKGIEKKVKKKKGSDLQGTKDLQAALKNQDEDTKSQEGEREMKEQEQCPLTESDDQAVPESAVESSHEVGKEEDEESEMLIEEAEQMQKEINGGQKAEEVTPAEVEESMSEVKETEQRKEEEEERGDKEERVAGKDEIEETQEPEKCVVEGLGLSDDEDHFLNTDLDIMACRDDLIKRLCADEEEEEELSELFEE